MTPDQALQEKQHECEQMVYSAHHITDEGLLGTRTVCEKVWDGILCWPPAKTGEMLYQPCPSYVLGFDPNANASKLCTSEGWWQNPSINRTWTNYTDCSKGGFVTLAPFPEAVPLLHDWVPFVKAISRTGYIVSLASLLLACLILLCNRRLRCPRNIIHLHLFVSFLMRGFMALLKDNLFVEGLGFSRSILYFTDNISYTETSHDWQCKVFTTFWQYFILANYSWILVEGVYLHNLIFMALFSDTSSIFLYVLFGWCFPTLFVVPWSLARVFLDDTFCWTTHSDRRVFLIVQIPTIASIVVNLILFLNITRVLLIKLKRSSSFLLDRRISRYRKWAKSTLVLMPLYGVHYALFLGLSYSDNPTIEVLWLFCDQLFASSQGLFVSILYCIINGEVVQVMKANWRMFYGRWTNREEAFDMWRQCENGAANPNPGYIYDESSHI